MKTLSSIKKGTYKRAIVRVDYNVPISNGKIKDARRIESSFATINLLHKKKIQVLLVAHMGDATASLRTVARALSKHYKIVFITESLFHTEAIEALLAQVSADTVVLFENIRRYPEEEANSILFAQALARLGDMYVNDAFSVSHRAHTSVVGISKKIPSYGGLQMEKELTALAPIVTQPVHPFVFILGGAKFGTKIPLLKRYIKTADQLVITGAIANCFIKAAGFEIGDSVVEEGYDTEIQSLLKNKKILLPVDVIVLRNGKKKTCVLDEVQKKDMIVDIGPQTIHLISQLLDRAKTIVWNGPTGWYEKGFTQATKALAMHIATLRAKSVIGGGDTGAVIESLSIQKKNVFVSTGGGATLEYLAKGTLPGVQSLAK